MGLLKQSDRIFVAGHRGLIGSSICDSLSARGYRNIITRSRTELDLLDQKAVSDFYSSERPDVVFIAAAKVGGIYANNTARADFIFENLQIQNNLIWGAHQHQVHRLIFLGSSCIYPRDAAQPMQETSLLTGPLEITNRPYAIAKIAGLELVNALRQQYQRDYFSLMPTNLYGPRDNFHPENSHVLPALIRRFVEAKEKSVPQVVVWGTGKPLREFLFAPDCADAIVHLAEKLNATDIDTFLKVDPFWGHVNVGSGEEISIKDLALLVAKCCSYQGEVVFDLSKPDGTKRKLLDVRLLQSLGWRPKTALEDGIRETISWYREHH